MASTNSSSSPHHETSRAMTCQSQQLQVTAPRLDPRFYNDTELCDITIVFGPEGEDLFEGQRLVVCNSIDWFNRSWSIFTEASSREITWHGDDPDAVRWMLKWAYFGRYVEAIEEPDSLAEAKQLFLQHLKVFVVADKYGAEGLEELALERLAELVGYYISAPVHGRPRVSASSFLRFVILFVHQSCFQLMNITPHASSSEDTYHPKNDMVDDAVVDNAMSDQIMYSAESDEDFFEMELGYINPKHPATRIQTFIVKQCMRVWLENDDDLELNGRQLQTLVVKVDGFGAAMAHEILNYTRVAVTDDNRSLDSL